MRKLVYMVLLTTILATGCEKAKDKTETITKESVSTTQAEKENDAKETKDPEETKEASEEKETKKPKKPKKQPVSLSTLYQNIKEAVSLPEMIEFDADYIENYFGILPSDYAESVFYGAADVTRVDTIIMLRVKEKSQIENLSAKLQEYLEQKCAETESYAPDNYALLSKSKVVTDGNYVYFVASEYQNEIMAIINKARS